MSMNQASQRGHVAHRSAPALSNALYGLEVVYYVRHLGHVKIGTTMNLPNRLRGLGVRMSDVLAIEWGGAELERQRHQEFAHLRADGDGLGVEHFRAAPELVAHVRSVRQSVRG